MVAKGEVSARWSVNHSSYKIMTEAVDGVIESKEDNSNMESLLSDIKYTLNNGK